MDDPPFTVTSTSGFQDDVWVIQATLRFQDGLPGEGSRLLGEGRLMLLIAIAEEGKRGRELGAVHAKVLMDQGDGKIAEIDPATIRHHWQQ